MSSPHTAPRSKIIYAMTGPQAAWLTVVFIVLSPLLVVTIFVGFVSVLVGQCFHDGCEWARELLGPGDE